MAVHSAINSISICCFRVILHFGFDGRSFILNEPVSNHCLRSNACIAHASQLTPDSVQEKLDSTYISVSQKDSSNVPHNQLSQCNKRRERHSTTHADKWSVRARSHEQRFPPNSLPKLHTLESTLTISHGIITVSQYRQLVKMF